MMSVPVSYNTLLTLLGILTCGRSREAPGLRLTLTRAKADTGCNTDNSKQQDKLDNPHNVCIVLTVCVDRWWILSWASYLVPHSMLARNNNAVTTTPSRVMVCIPASAPRVDYPVLEQRC